MSCYTVMTEVLECDQRTGPGMVTGIPQGTTSRIILHIDMDSFYASVEMHERPELRGKPVVIGADPKQGKGRGVVSTCSYEARAFGIRSAMPISQAFVLCPHAVFLPPDFPLYARISSGIMTILRSYGLRFEQVSIDEAFLDLSPLGSFAAAHALAGQIKTVIRTNLGLSCSVGVAPAKIVAKIASDFKKPDGLTLVEPENVAAFLAPMPVRKIPGIGKKSELELHELGIRSIGEIAAYDVQRLIPRFGRGGIWLHDVALGIDESDVEERDKMKSVSRETTFELDTDDPQTLFLTMDTLSEDVHRNLTEEGLRFKTITVKVRYEGFVTKTKAKTLLHFTDNASTLRGSAQALLRSLCGSSRIRLIGLRISSFEKSDAHQTTLSGM
jgi:DNA polymerase IV (archaeal DinB-like DNA polymerase)